ncbi:MAG: sulfotransferase [Boseongicola sp.]|nr:sulfotransferase [Boseongicola sp.]
MTVLFFCVGAAKAGTSWLHRQLLDHPECHLRAIKELHYFDALENGRLDRQIDHHQAQQRALKERLATRGSAPSEAQLRRLADRAEWLEVLRRGDDQTAYLEYLERGATAGQVVGDMTPAYALLPSKRLERMARMSDDVRMLSVLRDPIERLWSHVRMIAARRDDAGEVTARRCANILKRVFRGEEDQIAMRSDYASALTRLAAVPKLLVEVFEDMVAGPGFGRICDFLGIARVESALAPVHVGQTLDMTSDQRQAAAAFLAPQYDAAERALGGLPEAWSRKGRL